MLFLNTLNSAKHPKRPPTALMALIFLHTCQCSADPASSSVNR
jgi:hypothetical protein